MSMSQGVIALGAGLAIAIGAFGAATAQSKAAAAAFEGVTRNPASKDAIFTPFILALAFMEFQAILSFIVAFLLISNMGGV